MDASEVHRQSERLVNVMLTVHADATKVYKITERLVDNAHEHAWHPVGESVTDLAYDYLLSADKLVDAGRSLLAVGVYPHYDPVLGYWSMLEEKSDEQRKRLDPHLRRACLREYAELPGRKEAALAVIEGIAEIHQAHDALFYLADRERLSDDDQRLIDGIVELSLRYVESIAVVIRQATRIAPRNVVGRLRTP